DDEDVGKPALRDGEDGLSIEIHGWHSRRGTGAVLTRRSPEKPEARRSASAPLLTIAGIGEPSRFRAKWIPVRVKKPRQNKKLKPRSDLIGTEMALVGRDRRSRLGMDLGRHHALGAGPQADP